MLAKFPIDMEKVEEEMTDCEIARLGMIAELDAVNFYEQLAANAVDEGLKNVLLDIAKEEKTHVGEFQAMLCKLDSEYEQELVKGEKEADELIE